MIATNNGRLPHPGSQRGDTLIEVIVSALLLAVIVVGTLTGLNSANRATSIDRERSQADALAQQEEDQLRSEPIAKLSELSATHEVVEREVNAGGTKYTISSTAQYISDATATTSCSSATPKADYIQTASAVTWHELAISNGKPVVETSIISPPADSALIVQVTNQAGEPVPNMNVAATGATNMTSETSADGCAILGVSPGEYNLNVSRTGYVDEDGFANSNENIVTNTPFYVVAEATVKKPFEFAQAGILEVSFENTKLKATTAGDTFVAANNGMNPAFKAFGALGSTKSTVSSGNIFPFTSKYSVYAGTCEADNPHVVNSVNSEPAGVSVLPGKTVSAKVGVPPVAVKVLSGTSKSSPGTAVANAAVTLTDTGCGTKRELKTNASGELTYPAPYGTYSLCVTGGTSGNAANRKYTTTFANNTANGPSEAATMTNGKELSSEASVIYMGSSAPKSPGTLESGSTCP